MKKLIIPVALCCALMACGGAKTNSESADGKQVSADSKQVSADKTEIAAKTADPFTMVDGKLYDLKGKVKSCEIAEYESEKDGQPLGDPFDEVFLEFDNGDGFCTKNSDKEYKTVKRNGAGQVRAFTEYISEYQCDIWDSLFYNEAGFVERKAFEGIESMSATKFQYSGNILETKVVEWTGEGENGVNESFYTILDEDQNGNWTRRVERTDYYEWEEGNEKPSEPDSFGYTVQIRKIVYY